MPIDMTMLSRKYGGAWHRLIESVDGTAVTTVGPMIVDSHGNYYEIGNDGKIYTNGKLDHDPGANVAELYYKSHEVYQCNKAGQWYTRAFAVNNWHGPVPSPIASPTPTPTPTPTPVTQPESADGTIVTTAGALLWDASGNSYCFKADGKIYTNGQIDHDSGANVQKLEYKNHQVYQYNGSQWYTRVKAADMWAACNDPSATPTPTPKPTPTPSGNVIFFEDFRKKSAVDWGFYTAVQPGYAEKGGGGDDVWWIVPNNPAESDPSINPFSFDSTNGLTISALKTPSNMLSTVGGCHYITSQLVPRAGALKLSSGAPYSNYGYYEWLAKAAAGPGVVPALWLYNMTPGGIFEIDILEMVGNNSSMSVHTKDSLQSAYNTPNYISNPNGWHTFGVDWQSDKITFYLDNKQWKSYTTPSDGKGVQMFLIMSVNVAAPSNTGSWFGVVNNSTPFPAKTSIQYWGIWQNKAAADAYLGR